MDRGRQHIDANKLDLIGRMEGAWYTKTTGRFEMPPIALSDWRARTVANVVSRLAGGPDERIARQNS
jgi:hypothetical protein